MALRECPLCLTTTIRPEIDDHYSIAGKAICVPCRNLVISAGRKQPTLPPGYSQIPAYLDSPLGYEVCTEHGKTMLWICEMCEQPGCDECIRAHPELTYEPLDRCIEKRLATLHCTEYLARYVEMRHPWDEEVRDLRESVMQFCEQMRGMKAWEVYLHMAVAGGGFFGQLQGMYEGFAQRTVEQCLEDIKVKNRSESEAADRWSRTLIWTHWSRHSLYFLDLETREKERLDLSSDFAIPLFSRTILLPSGDIFLCGGRTESDSFSLNSCWTIERTGAMLVKRMPDLLYGRSNHWVLYYKGSVYVIAGCDQHNKFTNKCERFELAVNAWERIAGTNETRDSISAVVDSRFDCIYTAGGRVDNGVLSDSVERYDITRNTWLTLPINLPFQAYMQGIALLPGPGSRLLIFGGLNLAAKPVTQTCIIDLDAEKATEVVGMQGEGGCVVDTLRVYAGHVYTFCFSGFAARTWERWSIDFQRWENLPKYHS